MACATFSDLFRSRGGHTVSCFVQDRFQNTQVRRVGNIPFQHTGGSRDTHTGHKRGTRAHTGTRITQTNLTTIQTHQTHNPHDSATIETAAGSTHNSRSPGADRSPRPTQKRPPPANPTLPPPAPRAPPAIGRLPAPAACSKAVDEMKARAADA
jgi:hypothetical protein